MNVLAIVPARGGSKRVLNKNILPLAGKPLLAWTIEAALSTPAISRVLVSTDSEEIRQVALHAAADVPFLRPQVLAQDSTPDLPVCAHALAWLDEHETYQPDIIVWLRPTAPLRSATDIEEVIDLLIATDSACVRSVCEVEHHPYWMKTIHGQRLEPFLDGFDESRFYQRQMLPPIYRLNGAVDAIWRERIPQTGVRLFDGETCPYVMPVERSIDLDTETDYLLLQAIMEKETCQTSLLAVA